MTVQQLDAWHHAQPFQPFTVHMADDRSVQVKSPEFLWRTEGGRTIFVSTGGEDVAIIDLLLVTKLTVGDGARPRGRRS